MNSSTPKEDKKWSFENEIFQNLAKIISDKVSFHFFYQNCSASAASERFQL